MATIDIRTAEDEEIDCIRFTDEDYINIDSIRSFTLCNDSTGESFELANDDIPDLIKALDKVLEL